MKIKHINFWIFIGFAVLVSVCVICVKVFDKPEDVRTEITENWTPFIVESSNEDTIDFHEPATTGEIDTDAGNIRLYWNGKNWYTDPERDKIEKELREYWDTYFIIPTTFHTIESKLAIGNFIEWLYRNGFKVVKEEEK